MLTGPNVILTLKVAVAAVTVLLLASLVALARGQYRLHGRINLVFFTLTLAAVLGLELVIHVISPKAFDYRQYGRAPTQMAAATARLSSGFTAAKERYAAARKSADKRARRKPRPPFARAARLCALTSDSFRSGRDPPSATGRLRRR